MAETSETAEAPVDFLENLATEHGYLVSDAGALRLIEERDSAIAAAARREERARIVKRLRELSKTEASRDPHAFGDSGHRLQARESLIIACATMLTMAADLIESETP